MLFRQKLVKLFLSGMSNNVGDPYITSLSYIQGNATSLSMDPMALDWNQIRVEHLPFIPVSSTFHNYH